MGNAEHTDLKFEVLDWVVFSLFLKADYNISLTMHFAFGPLD